MELFISAGEASSDIHCAHLLRELKKSIPDLKSFGLGGDRLAAEGMTLLMHCREFSVMGGPMEILSKLPRRRRLELALEKRLYESRPAAAILVDSGEINLRLASLLHFFGVPVVYFIPPKVWVWRHHRLEEIAQHVKLVLSILPFEEPMYREWNVPFRYVGNPIIDEIPEALAPEEARRHLGLSPGKPVLAVLPGSRHNEIDFHADLFSDSIRLFLQGLPSSEAHPDIVIPVAPTVDEAALNAAFGRRLEGVRFVKGEAGGYQASHLCFAAARAALVKSGTSTLEGAALGTPMVLSYKASRSSEFLYKHLVRYRGFIGMANLFLAGTEPNAQAVIPEMILGKCSPRGIADELLRVYLDGPPREKMISELSRTRGLLRPPGGASPIQAAAAGVLEVVS